MDLKVVLEGHWFVLILGACGGNLNLKIKVELTSFAQVYVIIVGIFFAVVNQFIIQDVIDNKKRFFLYNVAQQSGDCVWVVGHVYNK